MRGWRFWGLVGVFLVVGVGNVVFMRWRTHGAWVQPLAMTAALLAGPVAWLVGRRRQHSCDC